LVLAVQAGRASEYFTETCRIDFGDPVPRIVGRSLLASQILIAQGLVEQVAVEALDVAVEVDPAGDRAVSRLTVLLTFREPGAAEVGREAREVELDWIKSAGRWRIETLRLTEILR
ncbi:MAG TPA: nuclear transport factor 2 family protein, partial [bacterium]|nr:nuclear transport factor 2 family protein [bacterium]